MHADLFAVVGQWSRYARRSFLTAGYSTNEYDLRRRRRP